MNSFGTYQPIKIYHPKHGKITVKSICSNEEHVGAMVADGDLPKEEYWCRVAYLYKSQLKAENQRYVRLQNSLSITTRFIVRLIVPLLWVRERLKRKTDHDG